MANDYKTEQQEEEFEDAKEKLIQSWIKNGADPIGAGQLFDEMVNDPYHSDPDMDIHSNPTIDERIDEYSPSK
ncbi:hypothetical protein [Methylobacter sp.]|uniref:hypothetical protein n=1 Tax=Methylobacter sp. TaxID=2051955 RepID=UPI0024892E9B|nr:hypothetical protein [Methylobacter sp.]MDI1278231.1 hypothetical protein [Methylobacter sp.]MDI1358974.1 hypothetical protein [Methylobacter sp.]